MRWLWAAPLVAACAAPAMPTPPPPRPAMARVVPPPVIVVDAPPARTAPTPSDVVHPSDDLFAGLPSGEAQRARLCARGHTDRISRTYCSQAPPTSIVELQKQLGLAYVRTHMHETDNIAGNARFGNPAFVLLGHSVSLAARRVSPINPRIIVFDPAIHNASSEYRPVDENQKDPDFVAMAFTRGEQFVELVDRDPVSGDLRFFVLRYEQACNAAPGGCSLGQVHGPATERGWKSAVLYDGTDLANTPGDCDVCHQPEGHGTPRMLLMSSRRTPWTHFFRYDRERGARNLAAYALAHDPDEAYGGIPGSEIPFSDPQRLQGLIENEGFFHQPLEVTAYTEEWGISDTLVRDDPSLSLVWRRNRRRAQRGEIAAVPFPVDEFYDQPLLVRAAAALRGAIEGRETEGPWPVDLHRDEVRPLVGLAAPAADGDAILAGVCRRCHHSGLDPARSRARFDVDRLDTLPDAILARARARIALPPNDPRRMPPARFGELDDAARRALDAALRR